MDAIILLYDSSRGVYIPKHFAQNCTPDAGWHNVPEDVRETLLGGLDTEDYWNAWMRVLDYAWWQAPNGDKYMLHQDGDLWALCYNRMTDEEKSNFGFDE